MPIFKWPCRKAKQWDAPAVMERLYDFSTNAKIEALRRDIAALQAENARLVKREVVALEHVARLEERERRMARTFRRLVRIYYRNEGYKE